MSGTEAAIAQLPVSDSTRPEPSGTALAWGWHGREHRTPATTRSLAKTLFLVYHMWHAKLSMGRFEKACPRTA